MVNHSLISKIIEEKKDRNEIEFFYNQCYFEITRDFLNMLHNFYDGIYEFSSVSSVSSFSSFSSASTPELIDETLVYFRVDSLDSIESISLLGD